MSFLDSNKDKDKDKPAGKHHHPPLADPLEPVPPAPAPEPPRVAKQLSAAQLSWFDTYNAAVSGMFANQTYAALGRDYVHSQALLTAELAHGTYPPDESP